jgi:ubiquinone/menaquinone biosynthesis C-methylase UbiE
MPALSDATRFSNVEATHDPAALVAFLDARTGIEGERQVKEIELAMLRLEPGLAVLDVGCGTGDDAREIAALVGLEGRVVGVDVSPTMIGEARKRSLATDARIEFIEGSALALPYPDESFDRVRTDRVLVHLQEPARALAEMVRVVRPGGRVVVSELDLGTQFLDSRDQQTTQRVLSSFADRTVSGRIGRALPRLLGEAGLSDIECAPRVIRTNLKFFHRMIDGHLGHPDVVKEFGKGELDAWWQDLAAADAAARFNYGVTVLTVAGRKGA